MGDPNAKVKVSRVCRFPMPLLRRLLETIGATIIENYVNTGKILYIYQPFSFLGTGTWDESVKSLKPPIVPMTRGNSGNTVIALCKSEW